MKKIIYFFVVIFITNSNLLNANAGGVNKAEIYCPWSEVRLKDGFKFHSVFHDTTQIHPASNLGLNKHGKITSKESQFLNHKGAVNTGDMVNRNGKVHIHKPDGLTAETAAASAFEIKKNFPAAEDGFYWIKNQAINGGAAFKIYADMTTDGGGWTLILSNTSNEGWNYNNAILRNQDYPSSDSNYSIIAWADHIKQSPAGFQYMIDAYRRRDMGGIWTANEDYTFVKGNNSQTNVTLNVKFGEWSYHDQSIEKRMPWYSDCAGYITTSEYCDSIWWGTLVAEYGWFPAPWVYERPNPGKIWYWVR